MILAVVDDLLFRSKIRTTAKGAGVELAFVASGADILEHAREHKPSLVIFDLNAGKGDPIAAIAAMKKDAVCASTPTLAFVSHVHTGLIQAARAAGAGEVMARSAFAAQLSEILLGRRLTRSSADLDAD